MGRLVANVPAYVIPARFMGDFSSILKGPSGAITRDINRATGKVAGGIFASANKSPFGVFGMIATAQFFSVLKQVVQLQTVEAGGEINLGTVMDYAFDYEHGGVTGDKRPFLQTAIAETPFQASRKGRHTFPTTVRSGLYAGQKFQDDFAGFFRGGDAINRIGRREMGREISGFWGALRLGADEGAPNILHGYAKRIAVQARKNISKMGQDTGTLRASISVGFGAEDMSNISREKAEKHIAKGGYELKRGPSVSQGTIPTGSGDISANVQAG